MGFPGLEYKRKRTAFTSYMILELEKEFLVNQYLNVGRKRDIAIRLRLPEQQIKIWFQNRRQKWKKTHEQRKGGSGVSHSPDPSSQTHSPHHHQMHQNVNYKYSLPHLHPTHHHDQQLTQQQQQYNQQDQTTQQHSHQQQEQTVKQQSQAHKQQEQQQTGSQRTEQHPAHSPHQQSQAWGGHSSTFSHMGGRMIPPGLVPISSPYSHGASETRTKSQSPSWQTSTKGHHDHSQRVANSLHFSPSLEPAEESPSS